jgi:Lrp/AsnC family transcriptional regulator for asnA, asnC and gidA
MKNLDLKDKKILYHLDCNARQSIPQLSKHVGIHRNALRYRLKRLERLGIITQYYTVIDSYKLGYMVMKFYTTFQNASSTIRHDIVEYFVKSNNTWVVVSSEGEFDFGVIFWIKDMNRFYAYWEKTLSLYNSYFKDHILLFQLQAVSYKPTYLIYKERPANEPVEISGNAIPVDLEPLDLQLLHLLAAEARIPVIDIARTLGITTNIVRYRLKKLAQLQVIQRYRIAIDISKLGFQTVKVDLFLNDYGKKNRIITYLKKNPYLVCIMMSLGYSHLELEFHVKNHTHLNSIMQELIDSFPDIIRNYHYFVVLKDHKLSWIPNQTSYE